MATETPNDPSAGAPVKVSRRSLLRGASAALPTVLTLHSGAALARSSNLIGTVDQASRARSPGGDVQCLDAASAVDGTPRVLDLGDQPMLHVQYIKPRQYFRGKTSGDGGDLSRPVSIEQMCREGGVYWYQEQGGWWPYKAQWASTTPGYNRRGIEAGFLVSATALSSFASAIKVRSNF